MLNTEYDHVVMYIYYLRYSSAQDDTLTAFIQERGIMLLLRHAPRQLAPLSGLRQMQEKKTFLETLKEKYSEVINGRSPYSLHQLGSVWRFTYQQEECLNFNMDRLTEEEKKMFKTMWDTTTLLSPNVVEFFCQTAPYSKESEMLRRWPEKHFYTYKRVINKREVNCSRLAALSASFKEQQPHAKLDRLDSELREKLRDVAEKLLEQSLPMAMFVCSQLMWEMPQEIKHKVLSITTSILHKATNPETKDTDGLNLSDIRRILNILHDKILSIAQDATKVENSTKLSQWINCCLSIRYYLHSKQQNEPEMVEEISDCLDKFITFFQPLLLAPDIEPYKDALIESLQMLHANPGILALPLQNRVILCQYWSFLHHKTQGADQAQQGSGSEGVTAQRKIDLPTAIAQLSKDAKTSAEQQLVAALRIYHLLGEDKSAENPGEADLQRFNDCFSFPLATTRESSLTPALIPIFINTIVAGLNPNGSFSQFTDLPLVFDTTMLNIISTYCDEEGRVQFHRDINQLESKGGVSCKILSDTGVLYFEEALQRATDQKQLGTPTWVAFLHAQAGHDLSKAKQILDWFKYLTCVPCNTLATLYHELNEKFGAPKAGSSTSHASDSALLADAKPTDGKSVTFTASVTGSNSKLQLQARANRDLRVKAVKDYIEGAKPEKLAEISHVLKSSITDSPEPQPDMDGFTVEDFVSFVFSNQCCPWTMARLLVRDEVGEANNMLCLGDLPNFVEKHCAKASPDTLSRDGWLIQIQPCVKVLLEKVKLPDSSCWTMIRYYLIDKAPITPDGQSRFTFFFKQGEGSLHLLGLVDWLNKIKQSDRQSFNDILSSLQKLALGEGNFGGDTEYRLICIIVIFMLNPNIMHDPTQRALQENLKSFAVKNRQFLFGEGKKYDLALTNAQGHSDDHALLLLQALIQPIWMAAWVKQLKEEQQLLTTESRGYFSYFSNQDVKLKWVSLKNAGPILHNLTVGLTKLLDVAVSQAATNTIAINVATIVAIHAIKQLMIDLHSTYFIDPQKNMYIQDIAIIKEHIAAMLMAVVLYGDITLIDDLFNMPEFYISLQIDTQDYYSIVMSIYFFRHFEEQEGTLTTFMQKSGVVSMCRQQPALLITLWRLYAQILSRSIIQLPELKACFNELILTAATHSELRLAPLKACLQLTPAWVPNDSSKSQGEVLLQVAKELPVESRLTTMFICRQVIVEHKPQEKIALQALGIAAQVLQKSAQSDSEESKNLIVLDISGILQVCDNKILSIAQSDNIQREDINKLFQLINYCLSLIEYIKSSKPAIFKEIDACLHNFFITLKNFFAADDIPHQNALINFFQRLHDNPGILALPLQNRVILCQYWSCLHHKTQGANQTQQGSESEGVTTQRKIGLPTAIAQLSKDAKTAAEQQLVAALRAYHLLGEHNKSRKNSDEVVSSTKLGECFNFPTAAIRGKSPIVLFSSTPPSPQQAFLDTLAKGLSDEGDTSQIPSLPLPFDINMLNEIYTWDQTGFMQLHRDINQLGKSIRCQIQGDPIKELNFEELFVLTDRFGRTEAPITWKTYLRNKAKRNLAKTIAIMAWLKQHTGSPYNDTQLARLYQILNGEIDAAQAGTSDSHGATPVKDAMTKNEKKCASGPSATGISNSLLQTRGAKLLLASSSTMKTIPVVRGVPVIHEQVLPATGKDTAAVLGVPLEQTSPS